MKSELIKWFEKYPNQFVAVYANGLEIGNYCTKNYKDLDRLYDDMLRHGVELPDISFKTINDNTQENLDIVLIDIESLGNELSDIKSAYQSALVKKQAIEANLNLFVEKQEMLRLFVDNFNVGKTDEAMELIKTKQAKVVLMYKHKEYYRLKRGISLYDELGPILKNVVDGIKLYRQLPEMLQETAFIEDNSVVIEDNSIVIHNDSWSGNCIVVKPYNNYYTVTYKIEDSNVTETVSHENLNNKLIEIFKNF